MEDALAPYSYKHEGKICVGLNPCCNGRCTRSLLSGAKIDVVQVLILVVMEDALALPPKN